MIEKEKNLLQVSERSTTLESSAKIIKAEAIADETGP